MKVSITQKHIEEGIKRDAHGCPIALAANEIWPDARDLEVDGEFLMFGDELYLYSYLLPPVATDFIEAFDDGKPVKPFEFELEVE